MLTFDLQISKSVQIVFSMYNLERQLWYLAFIDETLPLQFAPGANLS